MCQAACPACARETDTSFRKKPAQHLTVEQVELLFSKEKIAALEKMFMCGNYGDPAGGHHTIELFEHFRTINPNIVLGMNSNGAIRNTIWWHVLGKLLFQPKDYVVFSIDGLEDTNSTYRVNVNWTHLMTNARIFIAAGGNAQWDMLVYEHNQHQVDAAEALAREMGFKWFRAKVSKRPLTPRLNYPSKWTAPAVATGPISCHALKEMSAYIDASGRLLPCCWLGARQKDFITDIETVKVTWDTNTPNEVCKTTCSTTDKKTVFEEQWIREVELS